MLNEFEIIARYFARSARRAALGVGDDCALIAPEPGMQFAVTTDALLEGRHFHAGADAELLGGKALAVNLSDLAAMGALPRYATLALALPQADAQWLEAFARGLFRLADRFDVELIGGDTTRGPLNICITAIGVLPAGSALRRDGAQAGDDVWISGCTGEAALALAHLDGRLRLEGDALAACLERLHAPRPRVALGLALRGVASSAIDVSDGLIADLGHIAERSQIAIDLELERVPISQAMRACAETALARQCLLAGGDDYELAFTAAAEAAVEIGAIAQRVGLALTRIGRVRKGPGAAVRVLDAAGNALAAPSRGFDHFGSEGA